MCYKSEFIDIFKQKMSLCLIKAESDRKAQLIKLLALETPLFIAAFCSIYFYSEIVFSLKNSFLCTLFVLSLPFLAGIIFCMPFYFASEYKKVLKKSCMPEIIKCFDNMKWKNEKAIFTNTELAQSNLFSTYNTVKTDDTFSGIHREVDFQISETTLLDIHRSSKGSTVHTTFKGVIISFSLNKKVKANTIIATRSDCNIRNYPTGIWLYVLILVGGIVLGILTENAAPEMYVVLGALTIGLLAMGVCFLIDKKSMEEIKLEDPVFSKKFKVFSKNQVEARYLVTPAFMERFLKLTTAFGTKKAKCAFFDDKIMFAISTNRDLFEIGNLFWPLDNPKQMDKFFKELTSILDMIDYFKLDEKTRL